ncbi:hypothetical protein LZ32DRAFT_442468 [Colletotrichum eremochloae]|nr:hypothetical protein LZ32DRAFT_442468 [Colletotrichum eremochloae]
MRHGLWWQSSCRRLKRSVIQTANRLPTIRRGPWEVCQSLRGTETRTNAVNQGAPQVVTMSSRVFTCLPLRRTRRKQQVLTCKGGSDWIEERWPKASQNVVRRAGRWLYVECSKIKASKPDFRNFFIPFLILPSFAILAARSVLVESR